MANVLNTKPELLCEFLAHFATLGDAMDDGLRGRDRAIAIPVGFDGTFCKSTPHHSVTRRNGSESGVLLRAGS